MQNRVLTGVIALWMAVGASAQTLNELVQRGAQAERDGRYEEAVQAYRDARQKTDPSHPKFERLQVLLLLKEAEARSAAGQLLAALEPVERARFYDARDPDVQKAWTDLQLKVVDQVVTEQEISRAWGVARGFGVETGKPPAVDLPVQFRFDSAELTEQGERQAEEMLAAMRKPAYAEHRFQLVGHTDTQGAADYNLGLSRRRAESLRGWLLARSDLDAGRIGTSGLGESAPLVPGGSEAVHARNRRVELQLLR